MRTLFLSVLVLVSACKPEPEPPAPTPLTAPAAPSMLTATPGAGFVRLVWRDEATTEEGFVIGRVELSDPTAPFTADALVELTRVTADQVVFRDAPALGRSYGYGVAAFNAAGRSDFVLLGAPVAPLGSTGAACQVAVPSLEDVDGDGLSADVEAAGWTVRVNQNGAMQFSESAVTSALTAGDADGDGLCDGEERLLRTDPNQRDTDGDGLRDDDEVLVYGSSPINVDSDGDAQGTNTAFYDGSELTRFGTSPTLADTDGDGRSDFQEINQNSTNALVADLPQPKLELVGTVDVSLDVQLSNGTVQSNAVTQSMTRGTETATNQTSSTATTVTSERSVEVGASVSAGFPDGVSASVSASYGQTDGFMSEASTSFEQSSAESARQAYEGAASREVTQGQSIVAGKVAVQFEIANAGNRTFELKDLVVTALTRDRENPASVGSVATLSMPSAAASITLGEGQRAGPFRVEATVPANVALDLLANPSGLFFKPANFQLVDRTGTNFAFSVGEATANRTALIVLDYGGDRPLEQYRVATNVARVDGGEVAGLKMTDALAALGLVQGTSWESRANPHGIKKLTRVRDVAAQQKGVGTSKFWAVIAAENATSRAPVSSRLLDPAKHFDDLVLMPRDRVYLAYVADEDGDGLFSREERLYRTSDTLADTDGDGLSDREEIREGWLVFSSLPFYSNRPRVYSDPTRSDADRDNLGDARERQLGTDPNRADTDGDGVTDDLDPDPVRGIGRPLAFGFGTLDSQFPMSLVSDAQGNIVVLGQGGVDVDGDGLLSIASGFSRSAWLMGFDGTGRKRWAHELERLPPNTRNATQRQLAIGADGHVYFFDTLNAASPFDPPAFPGVMSTGHHLVELDPADGHVISVVPVPGLGDLLPELFRRAPNGDFVALGHLAGNFSTRVVVFTATGTVVATKDWTFSQSPPSDVFLAATNAGVGLMFAGCQFTRYDRTLTTPSTLNLCASMPLIDRAVWLEDGDVVAARQRVTTRFSSTGVIRWTNTGTGFDQVMSLDVDRVGRVFQSTIDASSHFTVRQLEANGTTGTSAAIPGTNFLGLACLDPNSNFVIAGSTSDGLGGRLPQRGPNDVVVVRNPQYLFQ